MLRGFLLSFLASTILGSAVFADNATTITAYSSEKPIVHKKVSPSYPRPQAAAKVVEEQKPLVVVPAAVKPVKQQASPAMKGNSLSIPSIGFQGSVVDVGVTAGNAIDVPATKVGRYVGSGTPGTSGAVFLDGHVDGVFARLSRLAIGQTVSLSYGGQAFNYKIIFSEIVPLAGIDMNKALTVYGGANEGLNMMTCAGTYIPSMGTYDKRLVVYAVRIL